MADAGLTHILEMERDINEDIRDVVRDMKTSGIVLFLTHSHHEPVASTGGNGGN